MSTPHTLLSFGTFSWRWTAGEVSPVLRLAQAILHLRNLSHATNQNVNRRNYLQVLNPNRPDLLPSLPKFRPLHSTDGSCSKTLHFHTISPLFHPPPGPHPPTSRACLGRWRRLPHRLRPPVAKPPGDLGDALLALGVGHNPRVSHRGRRGRRQLVAKIGGFRPDVFNVKTSSAFRIRCF